MRKLLLILAVMIAGIAVTAQTNYVPIVAEETITVAEDDIIYRKANMVLTHWDNRIIQYQLILREYRNDTLIPEATRKYTYNQIMDSTYTYTHNGNTFTHTGRWFVETIYEGTSINWELVISLGNNIYYIVADPDGLFIKP